MRTQFYLIVNKNGSVRTTKKQPGLSWDEISVKLNLELPKELFERPMLSANIKVDSDQVSARDISPELSNNIQEAIKQHAGIDIKLQVVAPEKSETISSEDIKRVAESLNEEITETQVIYIMEHYNAGCEADPSGNWSQVVEQLIHDSKN